MRGFRRTIGLPPTGPRATLPWPERSRAATPTDALAWSAQIGAPHRRVSGVVVRDDVPVAGAAVMLVHTLAAYDAPPAHRVVTDHAGTFALEEVAPDTLWTLIARAPDASGGAIEGATVSVSYTAGGLPFVQTDVAGAYELCLPSGPQLQAIVWAEGYARVRVGVPDTGTRIHRDVRLVPEASVRGRVERPDGTPVPGATVLFATRARELGPAPARIVSDESGGFVASNLAPGRYEVTAHGDGFATPAGTYVLVDAAEHVDGLVLVVEARATVSGRVVSASGPVSAAFIRLIEDAPDLSGQGSWFAYTQVDGTFTLSQVPPGEARFFVEQRDVLEPRGIWIDRAEVTGVVVRVSDAGAIRGRVVRDGQPVAGARVDRHAPGNDVRLWMHETDAHGIFEIDDLPPGSYTLAAMAPESAQSDEVSVSVVSGKTTEIELELTRDAAIEGRVEDARGAPVGGAYVAAVLVGGAGTAATATREDGTFVLCPLPAAGEYALHVHPRAAGYAAVLPPVDGTTTTVTVATTTPHVTGVVVRVRAEYGAIAGRVVNARGSPVSDVRVTASATGLPVLGDPVSAVLALPPDPALVWTATDGVFAFDHLPAATYRISAETGRGASSNARDVTVGTRDLVLTLIEPGSIEGTVAGFDRTPQVSAMPPDGLLGPSARGHVHDDRFEILGLPPGEYLVVATAKGQEATAVVSVASGKVTHVRLGGGGAGHVAGRAVWLATREPITGALCHGEANRPGNDMRLPTFLPSSACQPTGIDGSFALADVPEGDTTVVCVVGELEAFGRAPIAVREAQTTTVLVPVVVVQPAGGVDSGIDAVRYPSHCRGIEQPGRSRRRERRRRASRDQRVPGVCARIVCAFAGAGAARRNDARADGATRGPRAQHRATVLSRGGSSRRRR